jgi:pyrroline-5-carboxylate reductase
MCWRASASVVLAVVAMSSASELVSSKTYGFVGTGTMSSAIVRGLATLDEPPAAILVSPRNAEKAAALREAFPGLVTVAADNQAVLDGSEVVFIGVLPTITEETCRALSFKPAHTVVSLVSTAPRDGLRAWCAPVPSASVVRAIPLPPVARHKGATIMTPPHDLVAAIFDSLGTVIPVATEATMRKMMPVTGLMGQFYAMQRATQEWVEGQGVPAEDASKYVGAIFHCITYDTADAGVHTFDHLVKEQTPGGINEQVLA